ncbi:DUF5590 domain-containing protein [Planococcus sp. YIM B11945]|uniref:cell wall elongation regulator TseB-like domain-containing protein n=1 Tax=Planococcus sp. YIM B11945 TaxID=3435410 RepID=UPI003D7CDDBD
MKQWITFIVGFLSFLFVSLLLITIIFGNKPYSDTEKQAIKRVESEKLLEEVDRAYVYMNETTSVTIIGSDSKGKLKAVFVPAGKGEMEVLNLEGKVTAKEARQIALEEMDVKEILHTKLGLESEGPVWEVAFVNKEDRLNYVYVMAEDGKWWKRILNL